MTSQPLQYGSQPRFNPDRMIRRSLAVLALIAVCVWTIRLGFQRFYYIDYDSVQSALRGVPGGRIIDIGGFDDGLTWTVASAHVSVDGSAARTITFMSPGRGQLQSGSRMALTSIGPYQIRVEVSDDRVLVQSLDFGQDSEFKDVLPFVCDVNDLAATRRDRRVHYARTFWDIHGTQWQGSHVSDSGLDGTTAAPLAAAVTNRPLHRTGRASRSS